MNSTTEDSIAPDGDEPLPHSGEETLPSESAGQSKQPDTKARSVNQGSNVVLVGVMGCGKSRTGWLLAKKLGFGFLDLDDRIESLEGQKIASIFQKKGEAYFREVERKTILDLKDIRSHVIATGGGAVLDSEAWGGLKELGVSVWINTPAEEITRRFLLDEEQVRLRPLLSEVVQVMDKEVKSQMLKERIQALIGQRLDHYQQAEVTISDIYSTPELTAEVVKQRLKSLDLIKPLQGTKTFDRWNIM
jgi:shikimate kinase